MHHCPHMSTTLQDEEVEKACDACKRESAPHTARHEITRLPPVLVLHLKRFATHVEPGGLCT